MNDLTDIEKHQLIFTLLVAKFQSEKCEEVRQLDIVNKIIGDCIHSQWTEDSLRKLYEGLNDLNITGRPMFPDLKSIEGPLETALEYKQLGLIKTSEDIKVLLRKFCYPYDLSPELEHEAVEHVSAH